MGCLLAHVYELYVIPSSVCSTLGIPPTFLSVWTLDALSCPGVTPQEFDPQNAWKKAHSLICTSSLCFNNSEKNVMVNDVFLDQFFVGLGTTFLSKKHSCV